MCARARRVSVFVCVCECMCVCVRASVRACMCLRVSVYVCACVCPLEYSPPPKCPFCQQRGRRCAGGADSGKEIKVWQIKTTDRLPALLTLGKRLTMDATIPDTSVCVKSLHAHTDCHGINFSGGGGWVLGAGVGGGGGGGRRQITRKCQDNHPMDCGHYKEG